MQIFYALVVGAESGYFTESHHFISGNADRISEMVEVPKLKQSQIKADVCRIQAVVFLNPIIKTIEVTDVVHDILS